MCADVRRILPQNDPEFVPQCGIEWDDIGAAALSEVHIAADLVAVELVHGQTGKIRARSVGIPSRGVVSLCQGKRDGTARALENHKIALAAVAGNITVAFRRIGLNARCLLPIPVKGIK